MKKRRTQRTRTHKYTSSRNIRRIKRNERTPRRTRRVAHGMSVLLIILIIAVIMVLYVWQKVKIRLLVSEIDELKKTQLALKEENDKLKARVIQLSSYENITNTARQRLNMVFPPQEVIYLPRDLFEEE